MTDRLSEIRARLDTGDDLDLSRHCIDDLVWATEEIGRLRDIVESDEADYMVAHKTLFAVYEKLHAERDEALSFLRDIATGDNCEYCDGSHYEHNECNLAAFLKRVS